MDSFTVFFTALLSGPQVCEDFQHSGFQAHCSGARNITVSDREASVWVELLRLDELDPSDFDDESHWPIEKARVGTVGVVAVRRNGESDELAIRVADWLSDRYGGKISWDGMTYWENLYKKYSAAGFPFYPRFV